MTVQYKRAKAQAHRARRELKRAIESDGRIPIAHRITAVETAGELIGLALRQPLLEDVVDAARDVVARYDTEDTPVFVVKTKVTNSGETLFTGGYHLATDSNIGVTLTLDDLYCALEKLDAALASRRSKLESSVDR